MAAKGLYPAQTTVASFAKTNGSRWKNNVKILKKKTEWRLNTSGIHGVVSSSHDEENWQNLKIQNAMASAQDPNGETPENYAGCTTVIVGFNNAILATSASHCMGSGDQQACPQFYGVYWRMSRDQSVRD
jgi:hypothetical protein